MLLKRKRSLRKTPGKTKNLDTADKPLQRDRSNNEALIIWNSDKCTYNPLKGQYSVRVSLFRIQAIL